MRGVKAGICLLIGLLLVIPIVLAIDTEIKIKTIPHHQVQISAVNGGQNLESYNNLSDGYGDISYTFTFNVPNYDLFVYIKQDNVKIMEPHKAYESVTGEAVYLELAPSWFEFIKTSESGADEVVEILANETIISTNETAVGVEEPIVQEDSESEEVENPEENVETEDIKEKRLINRMAGSVVSKIKNNKLTIIYSVVGIVVIAGAVFFMMHRKRSSGEIKVTKLSDKISSDSNHQTILDVESKLKNIQDELDGMK
jgi:hypothetical protein